MTLPFQPISAPENILNLIFLVSTSGSMHGKRICQLNEAMAEALQIAEQTALKLEVDLSLRVVEYNSTAHWLYGSTESGVEHIDWLPLKAGNVANPADAIDLARTVMSRRYLGERSYKPVFILISDGGSINPGETAAAIERLKMSLKSSRNSFSEKAVRIAVGVQDANLAELERFASVGTLEHADGTMESNVPLVLQTEEIGMLEMLIHQFPEDDEDCDDDFGCAEMGSSDFFCTQDQPPVGLADIRKENYIMGKDDFNPIEGGSVRYSMNLIYLVDTSGSMYGERINQLNVAMAEALQVAEETSKKMEIDLYTRVVEFNTSAHWLHGSTEAGLSHIDWVPLTEGGGTDTAGAIDLARTVMSRKYLGERNYKPVVILITDGESNDPAKTLQSINQLKSSLKSSKNPDADKIIRIAIGVKDANRQELESFASRGTIEREDEEAQTDVPLVFDVDNIDALTSVLRNVTVSSIMSSIGGGVQGEDDGSSDPGIIITEDPQDGASDDEWVN